MNYRKLLRTGNDPILKTICSPVEPGESLEKLSADMLLVCKKGRGVGLAAPQVGVAKRVVMTLMGSPIAGRFYVNPEIVDFSTESHIAMEGCLSYPLIGEKPIRRAAWIVVRYLTFKTREQREERFDGFAARVMQHELDHLDGICKVGDPLYRCETPAMPKRSALLPLMATAAILAATGGRR